MPTRYNATIRDANLANVVTEAGASALIELWDGAQPATGGGTPAGTLLVEATAGATLGTVSSGVLTFGTVTGDTSANASGTPTFARVKQSGGTFVADYPVSGMAAAVAAQPYNITSAVITEGNA